MDGIKQQTLEHYDRMVTINIKQQTLEHYDRMIKWAEKQHPDLFSSSMKMEESLGESWFAEYCPYCQKNIDKNKCVLTSMDGFCEGEFCCGGLWSKMDSAYTWKDWITAAKKVREYIKENG